MNDCSTVGRVKPATIVGGISRSGTRTRNLIQAMVVANELMPRVSKTLATAPGPSASSLGGNTAPAARLALASTTA